METNVKPKKREWIKNAAIIFLAVLLILTFFSNTILNSSLPEVATREIAPGSVTARIRVTGTVAANQNYEVSVDESRKVRTVMVKQGQEVSAGDVLFVLSDGDSEELELAENTLRDLQRSYQEKLISASDKDYARENRQIQSAREALAEAERERDALTFDDSNLLAAQAALEQKKMETAAAQTAVDNAKQKVDAAKAAAEAEKVRLDPLKTDVENAKVRVSDAETVVNRYSRELNDAQTGRDRSRDASGERGTPSQSMIAASEESRRRYEAAQQTYEEAKNALSAANLSYGSDWDNLKREAIRDIYTDKHPSEPAPDWESYTDEDYDALARQYSSLLPYYMKDIADEKSATDIWHIAYYRITDAEDAVTEADKAMETARADWAAARAAVNEAYDDGTYLPAESYDGHSHDWWEQECLRIEKLLRSAQESLESAQTAQTRTEQRLTAEEANLSRYQEAITQAQDRLADAQELLAEAKSRESDADAEVRTEKDKQESYENDVKAAAEKVRTAQRTLADALADLQDQQRSDDRQSQLDNLELSDLAGQIDRQRSKVNELRESAAEKEVTTPVGGVIQSLGITAGQTTTPKTAMAVIELPDMGYALNASVSTEQARRVHVGDSASVANMYWGTQIDAELTDIKPDPKDPQNQKRLTFSLSGDVTPGAELTLSVGQRSAEYDFVVPNSALRSDANGDFILVVETRSSPLGNRYMAVRSNVTKLASDDTSTAVSGALNTGDFVITTSTAPIKNGDRVRLADTQN